MKEYDMSLIIQILLFENINMCCIPVSNSIHSNIFWYLASNLTRQIAQMAVEISYGQFCLDVLT